VAHDFNNLMTIVLSNLERAQRVSDDKEKCLKALMGAQDGAVRAAALTKQLLVFSRRQTGSQAAANINTVLQDAVSLSKNLLPDNVLLTLEFENQLPYVTMDVNEAVNAIVNLIVNARDAMPDGGEIHVSSRRSTITNDKGADVAYVEVCVADRGTGMAQDVIDHAFEPFFTTKPVGKGSGLGLSQVYGFATQSGGSADIKSGPGKGTSVSIYIPVNV
jgi:signal transduction histidine kinase